MRIAQGLLLSNIDFMIKHFQIYAIYDWLAYNENKEIAPAQEQGDKIFPKNAHEYFYINIMVFYIFVNCFKYEMKMPLSNEV